MKMQHHPGEDQDSLELIKLGHTHVQLTTKNMTLILNQVVPILTTAFMRRLPHTVLSKPRHSTSMMSTSITKVMTASPRIQMLKTAVDPTDVIPLEEDTVRTKHRTFLTQNVSKIFSSDTLIVRLTHLTIGMLSLTSMRCSLTISRIHMMSNQSLVLPPQFITRCIMDQSINHATLDVEERERQGTELLDMFALTVTPHPIDAPVAGTRETQMEAVCQANQKTRSIMPTNALSSSKRRIKDVRSHFLCGEAMVRRRDAATVNSVKSNGILHALPASLSLTVTFVPLFAQMEP